MINKDNKLWEQFKDAFKITINSLPIETLEQSWLSRPSRNNFYFTNLLPKIAEHLELDFKRERPFRFDAIFFKRCSQTTEVPVVYIEAENEAKSSNEEIYKLCCINAPLKILFICNEWNETQKSKISSEYWHYIIDDFAEQNLLSGSTCILIGAWDDKLRFYSYCIDNKGNLFEEETLVEV